MSHYTLLIYLILINIIFSYFSLVYLVLINIISFLIVYIDKKKAINHKWRIKESSLIFLSLIGGSIGILISMKIFRHKTKHRKFTIGVPLILLLQILIIVLLLSL